MHEEVISNAGRTSKYEDFEQLRIAIARILASNKAAVAGAECNTVIELTLEHHAA